MVESFVPSGWSNASNNDNRGVSRKFIQIFFWLVIAGFYDLGGLALYLRGGLEPASTPTPSPPAVVTTVAPTATPDAAPPTATVTVTPHPTITPTWTLYPSITPNP